MTATINTPTHTTTHQTNAHHTNSHRTDTAQATTDRRSRRVPLLRAGLGSGVAGAAATVATAAIARAAGIDLAVAGERIPLDGFAMLTVVGAVIGIGMAAAFRRWATHPRRAFVRTCAALTAVSIIPDVVADATTGTRIVLALTHVLAATIIVPALATRLTR